MVPRIAYLAAPSGWLYPKFINDAGTYREGLRAASNHCPQMSGK